MGTKNKPGKYDCYTNAGADEPMFVLLARDPDAPYLVNAWANRRESTHGPSEKVEEARACALAMEAWRATRSITRPEHSHDCIENHDAKQTACGRTD